MRIEGGRLILDTRTSAEEQYLERLIESLPIDAVVESQHVIARIEDGIVCIEPTHGTISTYIERDPRVAYEMVGDELRAYWDGTHYVIR